MNPWFDGKYGERLCRVPESNRLMLRHEMLYSICMPDNDLHLVFFIGQDQWANRHAVVLREEVVFMLCTSSLSLCRMVPDPRSRVHRLSSTWGIGDEMGAEAADSEKQLEVQGVRAFDSEGFEKLMEGAELHQPVFLEVESVLVQGDDPDDWAPFTTMFAKRNDEAYSYSFGQDAVNAIMYALLNAEAIRVGVKK